MQKLLQRFHIFYCYLMTANIFLTTFEQTIAGCNLKEATKNCADLINESDYFQVILLLNLEFKVGDFFEKKE